jgi:hypothetical protein
VEFDGFCGAIANACENADDRVVMVVAMNDEQPDDPDAVLLGEITAEDLGPSLSKQLDQLIHGRRMLGLATRVDWSPTQEGESSKAWLLVAVTRANETRFAVKRIVEDSKWWLLDDEGVPWFALSTAGSLTGALRYGKKLVLKQASNEELYRKPSELPHPPTDEFGRL